MKEIVPFRAANDALLAPREQYRGVRSFASWKFFAVFALYLASFLVFAHDPFFRRGGLFVYQQGAVTLLLAYVIVGAMNWEFNIFGKPAGANLLLQALQMLPLSLMLARLLSNPSAPPKPDSWKSEIIHFVSDQFAGLVSFIPAWLSDLFSNWQSAALLVLVLLFFCFRSLKLKLAFLLTLLVCLISVNIVSGNSGHFFLGTGLLAAGLALQFCRYDREVFFENVTRRILDRGGVADRHFAAVAARTMSLLYERERITRDVFLELVAGEYSAEPGLRPEDLPMHAGRILQRMARICDLVEVRGGGDGFFITADPMLKFYDNLLSHASVFPRMVLIVGLTLVWVLLPIDLIPDAIPIFGALDDVSISVISAIALKNSMK